jgi:hypothetical protein
MQVLDKPETLEASTPKEPTAEISRAEYQKLVRYLKKVEGRLRFQQAVRLLPYGILAGGLVGLVMAIISRVTPSFTIEQVALIAIPALATGILAVLLYAFFRPRKLLDTARQADVALGLKERLSTAVEGHLNPDGFGYKAMASQQFSDASRTIQNIGRKFSKALPLRMPRKQGFAAFALLPLLVIALVLPNPFSDQVKENQSIKSQIQQEAQEIEQLKQQLEKQDPEAAKNDPKTQELLKELEQAQKDLLDKSNNKDDALASLQKAEQELQNLADPNKTTADKAALENLARSFNSSDATKPAGQALQQNTPDKYDNAAKELEKLASGDSLDQLKKDSTQAQQLSDNLAKDAQNFKNSNPDMSQKLQNLSDAVKPNNLQQDPAAAQQALKDVAEGLRQTGQEQQISQQTQQAQSQLQKSEQAINQASQKGTAQNQNGSQSTTSQDSTSGDPTGTEQGQAGDNSQQSQPGDQGQQGQQGQTSQDQSGQGQQGQQNGQQGQAQTGQQPGQGNQAGQQGQQSSQPGQGQQGQQGDPTGQGQQGQQGQNGQQGENGQGQQGDQGQQGQQGDQGTDSDGQTGSKAGKGSSDNMYANPTMRNQNGTQTNIQGKDGQGPTNSQTVNGGNPSGDASVPYSDVLDNYQQQAAQQLDKNYIPITLKDQVKQYFEDLNNKNK